MRNILGTDELPLDAWVEQAVYCLETTREESILEFFRCGTVRTSVGHRRLLKFESASSAMVACNWRRCIQKISARLLLHSTAAVMAANIATPTSIQPDPVIRTADHRPVAADKHKEVALTDHVNERIILLNAMLRDQTRRRTQHA
jgi:hypothetical protein